MEDPEVSKMKGTLAVAHDSFQQQRYAQAKNKLQEIKSAHLAIELNILICQYKQNPQNSGTTLKKIMDILTGINIKLYNERPVATQKQSKNPIISIIHEFYFWNILVIAQQIGKQEIAYLIGNQALHYSDSLRTQTALMIIYQMLKILSSENRLASCVALVEKSEKIINHIKKLSNEEQQYRVMNQILFTRVLLKLGMIEESKAIYMLRLGQSEEELFKEINSTNQLNSIPFRIYQEFLHAEIQFNSQNYFQVQKILADIVSMTDELRPRDKQLVKAMVDINFALMMALHGQETVAKALIQKSFSTLYQIKQLEHQKDNERMFNLSKVKENLLYIMLLQHQKVNSTKTSQAYQMLTVHQNSYSFKINYRKAQACLNNYHEMLKNPEKIVPWSEIHDQYETLYFYPNLPYFQQKGKNKNLYFTNGKHFYRRYVINQWEQDINPSKYSFNQDYFEELDNDSRELKEIKEISKDEKKGNKGKKSQKKDQEESQKPKNIESNKEKQLFSEGKQRNKSKVERQLKLKQILEHSEHYLKQSLMILEQEKKVIVNFEGPEKNLTQQVNEKLYSEYIQFKGSILSLLCYVSLCKQEWLKVIHYAKEYHSFEKVHLSEKKTNEQRESSYNILSYQTQAFCELNRLSDSYEATHKIMAQGHAQENIVLSRSTINHNIGETYFEVTNQYNNLLYNISVLHSRDNRIAESHQSIQKLLNHMRLVPSNSQAKIPMCLVDLLIHYNLRTYNYNSAIQMIKRKRILSMQGIMVLGVYPTLSITK